MPRGHRCVRSCGRVFWSSASPPSSPTTPSSRSRSRRAPSRPSASAPAAHARLRIVRSRISAPASPGDMLPRQKLEGLKRRFAELQQLLCDPAVFGDPKRLNTLNRERGEIAPVVEAFQNYQGLERSIAEDKEALS